MDKKFPVYLKYKGRTTFIKIKSETEWDELRILGNFYSYSEYKAVTFVDRNLIIDWLDNENGLTDTIDENDFLLLFEECKNEKKWSKAI